MFAVCPSVYMSVYVTCVHAYVDQECDRYGLKGITIRYVLSLSLKATITAITACTFSSNIGIPFVDMCLPYVVRFTFDAMQSCTTININTIMNFYKCCTFNTINILKVGD